MVALQSVANTQVPHRAGRQATTSQLARLRPSGAAAHTTSLRAAPVSHTPLPLQSTSGSPVRSPPPCPPPSPSPHDPILTTGMIMALGGLVTSAAFPDAAHAFEIQAEPSNALSLPTWAIHVSSVVEWVTAMGLFWKYAEVTGNPLWKGMTWGMLPSLGSAMCACTWHFFYNAPSLEFLVALQALLTIVGNTTCWIAAYRLYDGSKNTQSTS